MNQQIDCGDMLPRILPGLLAQIAIQCGNSRIEATPVAVAVQRLDEISSGGMIHFAPVILAWR